jgi:hypothetical protein
MFRQYCSIGEYEMYPERPTHFHVSQATSISLALICQVLLTLLDSHKPIGKQVILFQT